MVPPASPFAVGRIRERGLRRALQRSLHYYGTRCAAGQGTSIAAVVHVDGTARPQTVSPKTNPRYGELIRQFYMLTAVPMLLNTSFNVQEPIVCHPLDAIKTFRSTRFDALVLENHLVPRQ